MLDGRMCGKCATGILRTVTKRLPITSLLCGQVYTSELTVDCCDSCDACLLGSKAAIQWGIDILAIEKAAINILPIGDFCSAEKTAQLLGITKRQLSLDKRIKRGFIIHVELDGVKLYYRPSIESYKRTGDGRINIAINKNG